MFLENLWKGGIREIWVQQIHLIVISNGKGLLGPVLEFFSLLIFISLWHTAWEPYNLGEMCALSLLHFITCKGFSYRTFTSSHIVWTTGHFTRKNPYAFQHNKVFLGDIKLVKNHWKLLVLNLSHILSSLLRSIASRMGKNRRPKTFSSQMKRFMFEFEF